tara:strand:- start:52 stop:282 length:231 start_codon:yes stop_codon:yes gene_type:complete
MVKISLTILVVMFIIAYLQSSKQEEEEPKPLIKLFSKQSQYSEWRNRVLKPSSRKKIMPDTDVERWRKEMVKHWRS